jgi:FkbM family methyltransferase
MSKIREIFLHSYATIFSKKCFRIANNTLLEATQRAHGYNNYRNAKESGEDFFIKRILAPSNPQMALDIGANTGEYSEKLLKFTNAKVILFEPQSEPLNLAKQRLSHYGDRAKFTQTGLGEKEESLIINYNPNASAHASFSKKINRIDYLSNSAQAISQVTTLDKYCKENNINRIDFIKIDVEGYEEKVLLGATEVIAAMRPTFVQLEFNWHHLFENTSIYAFSQYLIDYDAYQLIPNNWIKRDPKHPNSNIFQFSNFIFVRR